MELKYGKDYHNYFDVENYLDFYRDPKLSEFQYVARHEFWSRLAPRKNLRVLNFGGGPVISDLISAAPFVEEIIFAEYSERNQQAVEKWRQNLPDSHDWSAHFRFIVENLEGRSREEAAIRESELRRKITHILPCDIEWDNPVKWPSSWGSQSAMFDVVTTSLCLEACVTSKESYRHAIGKLKRYLKPGGYIVMYGVTEEKYYFVGQERFYCFPLTTNLIQETLASEGFKMFNEIKLLAVSLEPYGDAKEIFFVTATLEEV